MQSKNKNGLPNWKRNAIALALANALFITPASAVPCPNSITTSQQGCDATGVSPIDISSSGSVNTSGDSAIYYFGSLDGSLTNNGTISSSGDPNSYSATGILIINDLAGTLINNGLIEANLNTSPGTYFTGTGISVGNTLSGTLINSGTISATATGGTYANANGVHVNNQGGELNNSGSITAMAHATSTDGYASVNGVYAGNSLSGTLINSGSISSTATGTGASAVGVLAGSYGGYYGEEGPSFDLNNSGSIAATANATSTYGYATASGVSAGNGLSGTLTKSSSISATATGTGASAVGVLAGNYGGFYGEDGPSFDLNNSGSIAATANATSTYGYATASGVSAGNGLSGTLTNSGSISATATGTGASAYGVLAGNYGGYYGEDGSSFDLNNSGSIAATANATSTNGYATASGVSAGNGLSGALTNSGSISATATSDNYANAYGVLAGNYGGYSGEDGSSFDLNNSGSIAATANATSTNGYATASGVSAGNGLSGALTNSGSISATATGDTYANAYGVLSGNYGGYYGEDGSSFDLNNSGSIAATANATSTYGYATAYGVSAGNGLFGTLTNSGSISATATGDTYANAYGVLAGNYGGYYGENGPAFDLNNSGSIAATANAISTYGYATAHGVYAGNGLSGTLTNTGSISATATGTGAYAVGVLAGSYGGYYGGEGPSFDLNNSGSIAATANAISTYGYATAYGAYAGIGLSGALTNSGSISATATGNQVSAYGVNTYNLRGTLTNKDTGNISATATGTHAYANGVYVNNQDGALNNSGSIAATAHATSSDGYATANGVFVGNILSGTLTNSGSISATATGDATVNATGVEINPFTIGSVGTLNNTGAISATATGSNARAVGVGPTLIKFDEGYLVNLPAGDVVLNLNNSGKISGTADNARDGYSIYVDNGYAYLALLPALGVISPVNVSGIINNLASGLLSGNIYTGKDVAVNNDGTIAIPVGVQGHINGNYNQSSTGVLSIVATSDSNYSRLDVGGIATLAPSTTINVSAFDGTQTLALNGILANVLSADTLNTGTVNVIDNSVLFNFTPTIYTGNAGHIDLKVEKGIPVLQAVLNEGNYPAAGAAATLDNLIYNGGDTKPFGAVVNALGKMTTQQQLSNAVDQTLPALTSGVANMTILTTNAGDSIVGSRQELARGLSAGDGLSPDSHVWLKPFGNWTQQDKRDGVTGYNADNFGIALGGDMDVTSTWNAGAAFIYTHGNVHSNNMVSPQRIDMNTYSAKLYATKNFGESTRLNFQAGGGASTYDSSRNIAFMGTLANAEYDGRQGRAKVELEHDFVVAKKTKLTPYVSLNYVHVHVDGYNEKGANALNLKANGDSQDSLVIGGGVKVAQEVTDKLLLTAKAGGGYDPVISASTLTSSFSGGGAVFSTQGISPAKGVFGGNVSAKYTLSTHSEITAGYDVQARENFIDQAATLNVRIKF